MERITAILLAAALMAACAAGPTSRPPQPAEQPAATPQEAAAGPDLTGAWIGTLDTGALKLRLVFRISSDGKDGYTAVMDSPDQGARDIPVSAVKVTDATVRLEIAVAKAFYEGTLDPQAMALDGAWNQGGGSLPLKLVKGEVEAVRRPQTPTPPYPYRSEEVTVRNEADGVTLAGTLTLPQGSGPFPAAVLITGSGPENRDEELFQHKPFLVLADALTRRGIAVLRYDDRGVGGSTGNPDATSPELARDAESVFRYLRGRPEIDQGRVGLIGHSEGGLIGPMIAARVPQVAFVVLLGGPALSGDEIMLLQTAAIMRAGGATEAQVQEDAGMRRRIFDVAKSGKDTATAQAEIEAILRDAGVPEEQRKATAETFLTPWMRFFIGHDPRPDLRALEQPVLALDGGKDLQVPARENTPALREALSANPGATVLEMPGLNHLFQHAGTGMPTEYGVIEETMAPEVLQTVADWILAR